MRFTKKVVALLAGVAMCAGLAACGGARGGQSTGSSDDAIAKGDTIGISMPTKSEERWNKDGNNLKTKLEKAGYKVILSFADDKPAQQNADIENMVNNNAKLVVVASKDGTAVGPAVEKAHDAGAKVIAYDRLIMNTKAVDYYATFQLEQVGVLEATYLIEKLGLKDGAKGPFNIELFTGSPDDNNAKYFFKGAWELLQPYFASGALVSPSNHGQGVTKDFKVDDWQSISVQSWKTEQAQKDMESILDSTYAHGEKLDAVLSPYDGITQGVINAIESKRPDMKPGTDSCRISPVRMPWRSPWRTSPRASRAKPYSRTSTSWPMRYIRHDHRNRRRQGCFRHQRQVQQQYHRRSVQAARSTEHHQG